MGPRVQYSVIAVTFIMMLAQIYLYRRPEIEIKIFNFNDYIYFRWWGMAFIFSAIGVRYEKIKTDSKITASLFIVLAVLAVIYLWRITIFNTDNNFDEAGFFRGVCFQSSGHTCSAAACVFMLDKLGVKAGETEMSKLCLTQVTGTEYINIVRGLRLKLDSDKYEVKLTRENYDSLQNISTPFITNIYVLDNILHTVTVLSVDANQVELADSLEGRIVIYKKDKFIKAWENLVVHVKKK